MNTFYILFFFKIDRTKITFPETSFCIETPCSTKRYDLDIRSYILCKYVLSYWNCNIDVKQIILDLQIQTTHRLCYPSYNFPYCTCAVSVQSGQDVFLIDVCHKKSLIDYISCNDSVMQVNKLRDKLYKVYLFISSYLSATFCVFLVS